MNTICGIDCANCEELGGACKGCAETGGQPFGAPCIAAAHCKEGADAFRAWKQRLIDAFNAQGIEDMEPVTDLHALKGSIVNLAYPLPGGQTVRFWDDNAIIMGNQAHKKGSDRCYGLAANETYLMISEYGCNGANPEVVVFKRWN